MSTSLRQKTAGLIMSSWWSNFFIYLSCKSVTKVDVFSLKSVCSLDNFSIESSTTIAVSIFRKLEPSPSYFAAPSLSPTTLVKTKKTQALDLLLPLFYPRNLFISLLHSKPAQLSRSTHATTPPTLSTHSTPSSKSLSHSTVSTHAILHRQWGARYYT